MTKKNTIPQSAIQNRHAYAKTDHTQLGTLHERMKWLVGCKEELQEYTNKLDDKNLELLVSQLSVAVMDLETEVAYTDSVKPPFARRGKSLKEHLSSPYLEHKKNS